MEGPLGAATQETRGIGQSGQEILNDMDAAIERLQPLKNRISSIAARTFGPDPSPLGDSAEKEKTADNFLAQCYYRQNEIARLVSEMEEKVSRIEEFI